MSSNVSTMVAWGAVWQGLLIRCTAGGETRNVHLATSDVRVLTDEGQRWRMIDPALAVFTSASTNAKIALLREVCQAIGYDPDEILFYMRPEEAKGQSAEADNAAEPPPPMRIW